MREGIEPMKTDWKRIATTPPPEGVHILIKTKSGLVRIAKFVKYGNGCEQFQYSSIYFKNVLYWQPLPK
jgi:hypothetical protein